MNFLWQDLEKTQTLMSNPTISLEEISLAAKNKGQDVNSAGVRSLIQRITGQKVETLEDIDALDKVKKQAVFHNI